MPERSLEMHTSEFVVRGMSCGGCEASVREAVSQLSAVTDVQVSAQSGRLTVTAQQPVDDAAVLAAVEAAGYRAASVSHQATAQATGLSGSASLKRRSTPM